MPGRAFSHIGYSTLIKRASKDGVLTLKVGQRDDLSDAQLKDLLEGTIDVVRRRLFEVVKPDRQADIKRAMNEINGVPEVVESRRDFVPAQRTILALHKVRRAERGGAAWFCQGPSIRGIGRSTFRHVRREDSQRWTG